jgi:small subunit ribosomal protein S16
MAVRIRLARHGAKKNPIYTVVAQDSNKKRDGEYLARFGQYWPKAKDAKDKLKVDVAAIEAWRAKGAQVSETVGLLLKSLAN